MTDSFCRTCRACTRPIADEWVEKTNNVTGETVLFHSRCWDRILEERRMRPILEAERRNAAMERIANRFATACAGPDGFDAQVPAWPYARFDNQTFRRLASPTIVAAVEPWTPASGSLILSAKTGAGKTACAVALLHRLHADASKAADPTLLPWFLFTTAAQLSGARRQQKLGAGESYLVEQAMHRDLLILDEIGFEPLDGVSFEVIDTRYRKQLPTIVTTGLPAADFAQRYGSAVWRRLTESGTLVEDHGGRKMAAVR